MTASLVAPATPLERRLARVIAETLRVPLDLVLPGESLAALGMDSLAAVELTAAIEDEIGIELPLTAVHEFPTLELLAAFIEGGQRPATTSDRHEMLADAVLPPDITPNAARRNEECLTRDARSVLLTGATGFVGAYLLRAIADETNATIHCLVRSHAGDPRKRLRDNLERYGLWLDVLDARIHIVEGDLTLPRFGLSHDAFERLAANVDAVYHAAADVNWVASYRSLRSANVFGTVEILRLACAGAPKPVHFLSSVSVCHSTSAPSRVNEDIDPLKSINGLWMGYAQTKCVAEALVRAAGERGLTVTIIRPSLVTGDRLHGRSNPDDLVSRFIAGCIRMRAAPDLDWRMDCVPVDDLATSIVRLTGRRERGFATSHITATEPRHWRECVLWMRLAGYDIELIPYREWMHILRAASGHGDPLQSLRSFFLHPIAAEQHLTLPELFEETRRTQVSDARTREVLSTLGHSSQPLTTELLSRYFDDYERHGLVPRSPTRPRARATNAVEEPSLAAVLPTLAHALGEWTETAPITIERVALLPVKTNDSIVAELMSWRGGARAGLYHADVTVVGPRGNRRTVRLFVKSKPADSQVIEVAEAVAALASPALGETVSRFHEHLGFTRSHSREVALYADLDPRFRRNTPRVFATHHDDDAGQWLVVMESLDGAHLSPGVTWSDQAVDAAIVGLAQIHAAGIQRRDELTTASWQAPRRDKGQRRAMLPLWSSLATHAFDHSPAWADRRLRQTHERLVEHVAAWSSALDTGPSTLIHNDFNPRNMALRPNGAGLALCAFDWELATMGLPQRDLAELLAFVLPVNASRETIARRVEQHRVLLQRETGVELDRDQWERGFSAALCDLLVDRLASYAMVNRIRAQSFLPRVVGGWNNLFHYFPWG